MKEFKNNLDMKEYLEARITYLTDIEMDYINEQDQYDDNDGRKAFCLKRANEFHARRRECESLLRFLNSENTEGVSDASHKSGVLHDVGESHASGENCESDLASGELPLEKITDDGNICHKCQGWGYYDLDDVTELDCEVCQGSGKI